MTILMLGFESSYPPLLGRAVNDKSIRFVCGDVDENEIDCLIVNGDELGENSAIRKFEEDWMQFNTPTIIAAYSTLYDVQPRLSTSIRLTEIGEQNPDACFYSSMPLNLEKLNSFLYKSIEVTSTEERREQLNLEHFFWNNELLRGYRHDIGYPDCNRAYIPKGKPKAAKRKIRNLKKWLQDGKVKEVLDQINVHRTAEENDALTHKTNESIKEAEHLIKHIHTELEKRVRPEKENGPSSDLKTTQDSGEQRKVPSEPQTKTKDKYQDEPLPTKRSESAQKVQSESKTETEPRQKSNLKSLLKQRLLIIDDFWEDDDFRQPYHDWNKDSDWELIFADFSLEENSADLDNLIELLFYPKDEEIKDDEAWEKLKSEKCFLILLDNYYGAWEDSLELGRLFLSACVGLPGDDEIREKIEAHCNSDDCDKEDERIRRALDKIEQIRERAKSQILLPKIALHSDYNDKIVFEEDFWTKYDQRGHLRVPKRYITENPDSTRVFLKSTYMMSLGQFADYCYDNGLIGQRYHISDYGEFKGVSKEARRIYEQIRLARSARDATVLIIGESGTGKELIAQEIAKGRFMVYLRNLLPEKTRFNRHSLAELIDSFEDETQKKKIDELFKCYFKPINIGAITTYGNLMQTELFGAKKGYPSDEYDEVASVFEFAPPDSTRANRKRGKNSDYIVEHLDVKRTDLCKEGMDEVVVFMDEIGMAPEIVQVGLLRVLQEKQITPLPTSSGIKVDVCFKLISATNANLKKDIYKGKFRKDLYYRISDFVIEIPELSERRTDIPILIETFTKKWVKNFARDLWRSRLRKDYREEVVKEKPDFLQESNANSDSYKKDDEWIEENLLPKQFQWKDYVLLLRFSWPGNVRELEQVIKQSLLHSYYEVNEDAEFVEMRLPDEIREKINTIQN